MLDSKQRNKALIIGSGILGLILNTLLLRFWEYPLNIILCKRIGCEDFGATVSLILIPLILLSYFICIEVIYKILSKLLGNKVIGESVQAGNDSRGSNPKLVVYWMIAAWLWSLLSKGTDLIRLRISQLDLFTIIMLVLTFAPLVLIPVAVIGLWSSKRWGLILGYVVSTSNLIISAIFFDVLGLVVWGIVLYSLIKSRNAFLG